MGNFSAEIGFYLALAAFALGLVSLAVSLLARSGNVRQLALDVAELYDRVDHWQRRDRVRKLREGQEQAAQKRAANGSDADYGGGAMSKAELRELVFGKAIEPRE